MTTSARTWIGSSVAVGVGLIALAGPALATGQPDPKVTTVGSTHTLKVFAHETKNLMDGTPVTAQPTAPPKLGGVMEFTDDLSQDGVKVGSDSVRCMVVPDKKLSCAAIETFGNGAIMLNGTTPLIESDDFSFDVPITSGTGAYQGATGTMHLTSVPGTHGADGNMTFTYTLASKAAAATSAGPTATPSATGTPTVATQVAKVPSGGAETGGGSTAGVEHGWLLGLGAATAAVGAGTLLLGRRKA